METPFSDQALCRQKVTECDDDNCLHEDKSCKAIASIQKVHDLFYATDEQRHIAWGPLSDAVRLCAACPVAVQCLKFASMSPHSWKHGVFGGMLGSQRFFVPQSRTEANLERALEDQEFILDRVNAGQHPREVAQELQEVRRREKRSGNGGG